MSSHKYCAQRGLVCPQCRSEQIEAPNGVEIDAGTARQEMGCLDCGATWEDVYTLIGYDNLRREVDERNSAPD